MPPHWGYVLTAYGIAVVVLFGYWRHLARRARAVAARRPAAKARAA
jgi:cytochrome oxidase assembly protein ShyY1